MRSIAILEVSGVQWATSKNVAEAVLSGCPGVLAVEANPVAQTATVTYDPSRTSVAELAGWVRDCGYHCADLFTVGQTVGQPTRTVADTTEPAHAPRATLARVPMRSFCPDTEEVTGSNPVSPTSNTPSERHFRRILRAPRNICATGQA